MAQGASVADPDIAAPASARPPPSERQRVNRFTPHQVKTDERGVVSFVNRDFLRFTGFSSREFVGRKCNFLQGSDTDPEDVLQLSRAVSRGEPASVVILNYTKGGTPFWNILRIEPMVGVGAEANSFVGNIISLPVPFELRDRPRLCFDDALALMRVFGSVPRSVKTPLQFLNSLELSPLQQRKLRMLKSDGETSSNVAVQVGGREGDRDASDDTTVVSVASPEPYLYQHVHYAKRFPNTQPSSSGGSSASSERQSLDFIAETSLPTGLGRFRVRAYRDPETGAEPLAMIVGDVEGASRVACRVHDQCVTPVGLPCHRAACCCRTPLPFDARVISTDRRSSARCAAIASNSLTLHLHSCSARGPVWCYTCPKKGAVSASRTRSRHTRCRSRGSTPSTQIASSGSPMTRAASQIACIFMCAGLSSLHLLYIQIKVKPRAFARVQYSSALTNPYKWTGYESVLDILTHDLGIQSVRLLTNNPRKIACLEALGVQVVERIPIVCEPNSDFSRKYVQTKVDRMGHMIHH